MLLSVGIVFLCLFGVEVYMHTFPVFICIFLRISDVGQIFMYLLASQLYVFFDKSVVRIFTCF